MKASAARIEDEIPHICPNGITLLFQVFGNYGVTIDKFAVGLVAGLIEHEYEKSWKAAAYKWSAFVYNHPEFTSTEAATFHLLRVVTLGRDEEFTGIGTDEAMLHPYYWMVKMYSPGEAIDMTVEYLQERLSQ